MYFIPLFLTNLYFSTPSSWSPILHPHLGAGDWGYHVRYSHILYDNLIALCKPLWESIFLSKSNLRKLSPWKQFLFSYLVISVFTIYLVNTQGYINYADAYMDVLKKISVSGDDVAHFLMGGVIGSGKWRRWLGLHQPLNVVDQLFFLGNTLRNSFQREPDMYQ